MTTKYPYFKVYQYSQGQLFKTGGLRKSPNYKFQTPEDAKQYAYDLSVRPDTRWDRGMKYMQYVVVQFDTQVQNEQIIYIVKDGEGTDV